MQTTAPLVTADDLPAFGPVRLLYIPAGEERPDGLTSVPISDWTARAKESPSGLDEVAYWQAELENLGVGSDALTVILDDGRMTEAARVWFVIQYFGLPVAVLNGGLEALETQPPQAPPATAPLHLHPGAGPVGLTSRAKLKTDLPDVQVFDARTAAEFLGDDLKGNARGGHLPGAANLSHKHLLAGSRLKTPEELAQLLARAGIDGTKPIVSHCNGGGRAALSALAAVVAGKRDVHVYYLSFADWAADESCPVQS